MPINGDIFHIVLSADLNLALEFGDHLAARKAIRSNRDLYSYIHRPDCLLWIARNAKDIVETERQWTSEDVRKVTLRSVKILLDLFVKSETLMLFQLGRLACMIGRTDIVMLYLQRKMWTRTLYLQAVERDDVEMVKIFKIHHCVLDFVQFDAVNCIRHYYGTRLSAVWIDHAFQFAIVRNSQKALDHFCSRKIFPSRTWMKEALRRHENDDNFRSLLHTIANNGNDWKTRWTAKYWIYRKHFISQK